MEKLNLGAGLRTIEGYVNHDKTRHHANIDVAYDLNRTPWAIWKNNQFIEIQAISVFEHLKITLIETLDECHRILRPNGILYIKYPHKNSPTIHSDPTHYWYWDEDVLSYVDPEMESRLNRGNYYGSAESYGFYTDRKWSIININVAKSVTAQLQPIK